MNQTEKPDTPLLRVEGLTKRFGGITAVNNIGWEINGATIKSIVGPNGAGKSTFFKLLVGHYPPTEGQIYFQGKEITGMETYARVREGLSMKYQVASVYEGLSTKKNLDIATQQSDRSDETSDALIDRFHLREVADITAKNLSHGQKQWLEIAMAFGTKPKLLLLDEPTAGMSVEESEHTAELLRELKEESSLGIIIIDHDMSFIENVGGDITVFHRGEVFAEGSMDEIRGDPDVQRIYLGD